jgi:peroxin-13
MQGGWDPSDPAGRPMPPSAWQAMIAAIGGVVTFFGRLSFLVDENAHAMHFFVSALLQLLDRFGSLYGELARFVLRLLGFRSKEKPAGEAAAAGGAGAGVLPATRAGFDSIPWGARGKPQ